MMLRKLFMLLSLMLVVSVMPAFAQDTTGQEAAQEAAGQDTTETLNQGAQGVTRFRIINLSPDAPTLTTFINGQPSGLQDLAFPAMTGWIEVPAADLSLSFSETGGAAEQPLVGPMTISGGENWLSIVLVGSAQTGTLAAYRLDQLLAPIPDGCAWVTVFHGMEGAPAVDAMLDTGAVLGPSILYPSDRAAGAEATAQAAPVEQSLMPSCSESTVAGSMAATPVQCVPLTQPMMRGAESTAEAAAPAAGSVTCAFSFLIPAGLYNLQFAEGGGGAAMLSLPETQLDADTYYFLGLTGTAASPQFFAFPVPEAALVGMLEGAQAGAPPAETTPEAGA